MNSAFAPINTQASIEHGGSAFAASSRTAGGGQRAKNEGPRSEARAKAESASVNLKQPTGGPGLFSVPSGRVLLTLNQLAVMSQNGIEIADAVDSVAANCADQRLAESLDRIHDAISSGHSFSGAVAAHGKYFPSTLAPMLAAAEASGTVPETLRRVCQRMRDELQIRGAMVGALIYPVILVGASVSVIFALVLGVLPQFSRVFESMGKPIPVYTQWLLWFGDFIRAYWMFTAPSCVAFAVMLFAFRSHALIKRLSGSILLYTPMLRDAYRPLQAGRNLRTLAAMVSGGVPLLQAVQLTRHACGNHYWQQLLDRMEELLIDGAPASRAVSEVNFVPPETMQLFMTGEKTGRVAEVLEDIGKYYEEEAARKIKRLVVALEPTIILIMGVVVAGIVMSVMLPLLDVSTIQS